jgi:hypothetical protein
MQDQSQLGGRHSAAATRHESINDIIARMNAEYHHAEPSLERSAVYGHALESIRVPLSTPCHIDDLGLLAEAGKAEIGNPVGPAAILGIFARMLRRARWALYRNNGRAASSWSPGERLSVALVLGDQDALDELGYTPAEAADAVSTFLALPPNEIDRWIGELRAVL